VSSGDIILDMDDLAGLDWSSTINKPTPPPPANPSYSYPALRPTPSPSNSGRSTPLNLQQPSSLARPVKLPSKPATPANDPFASSFSIGSRPAQDTRSLQERQQALQEEKARKEAEKRKQFDSHFGAGGSHLDSLGQNGSGPSSRGGTPAPTLSLRGGASGLSSSINKPFANLNGKVTEPKAHEESEDDILAAFNSAAPVDASSYYPPPQTASGRGTPAAAQAPISGLPATAASDPYKFDEDDDPFGLNHLSQKPAQASPPAAAADDDDILGMLAKPVSELKKPEPKLELEPAKSLGRDQEEEDRQEHASPEDKAVAELVDMGFPPDKAAIALAQTDSGVDIQAAVGILLNHAHQESRQKAQARPRRSPENEPQQERSRRQNREPREDGSVPAWAREEDGRARAGSRNKNTGSPGAEKDAAYYAQDIGSSLFKSANSLWKASQKKVQRAMADFEGKTDPSQPKWMRDAQLEDRAREIRSALPDKTDEAAMLETGGRPQKPPRKPHREHFPEELPPRPSPNQRDVPERPKPRPKPEEPLPPRPPRPANATRMTKQELEDQTPEMFVSPARRRRGNPTTSQQPTSAPLSQPPSRPSTRSPLAATSPPLQSKNPFLSSSPAPQSQPSSRTASKPATPIPTRPKAPPRQIPPTNPTSLAASAKHRAAGTEAFKRGDYALAHESYTSALRPLPQNHPITIVVLCNRALTAIKTGDAKAAVADADLALAVIGPSRGESEKIALADGNGDSEEKEMREFYGKALMRKAEGLEHLERWADAAKVWKEAVEGGVGGAVSISGRNRCEKAAVGGSKPSSGVSTPQPQISAARRRPPPSRPKPSALADLTGAAHSESSEAVQKLRAQHAAQSAEDDEKFALTDAVDAKLVAWKGTKKDNLRALLGSLDSVLWADAGWKKVGMNELVQPSRVKIVYMKAIAKVHPDKVSLSLGMNHRIEADHDCMQIPQNATTEQKMISASVFATLNEAWDKFKTDNGL
jgi:hypothetical protein